MTRRKRSGATLALIIASIVVLFGVFCCLAFIMMTMGGGRELQNTIDSGDMNLTNQALVQPPVSLSNTPASTQFQWLGDSTQSITLNSINRVMAQAMLVSANGAAMTAEGSAGSEVDSDVDTVVSSANAIANTLASQLSDQNTLSLQFQNLAATNSLRMLIGSKDNAISVQKYEVAFVDRGNPSNVSVLDRQIPSAILSKWGNLKTSSATQITGGSSLQASGSYMNGYVDNINFDGQANHTVYFVPLKDSSGVSTPVSVLESGQTHLISGQTFGNAVSASAGSPSFSWANPVPNSFRVTGRSGINAVANQVMDITSSAVARSLAPADGFQAAIPNGFIRIVNSSCGPSPNTYGFKITVAPAGEDLYTFLNDTPVIEAKGPAKPFFVKASDADAMTALGNIVAANKAGKTPDPADVNKLAGEDQNPPTPAEAAQITGQTGSIDNSNAIRLGLDDAISNAFGLAGQTGAQNLGAGCMAAVELANVDLLSQRYDAASPANIQVATYFSGVTVLPSNRGPLAAGSYSFTSPATLASVLDSGSGASSVEARIAQRCSEIYPAFSGLPADLSKIDGWANTQIPIGQSAYIFFLPDSASAITSGSGALTGKLVVRAGSDPAVPKWLSALENSKTPPTADGVPAAYDQIGTDVPVNVGDGSGSGGPPGIIDVNGDWGFPHPYDGWPANPNGCNMNTFLATPSTGLNGLLMELRMGACFGQGPCSGGSNDDHADIFSNKGGGGFSAPAIGGCAKMSGPIGPFTGPC